MTHAATYFGHESTHMTRERREMCKAVTRWLAFARRGETPTETTFWVGHMADLRFLAGCFGEYIRGVETLGVAVVVQPTKQSGHGLAPRWVELGLNGHRLRVQFLENEKSMVAA